ncbi:MULTISPECIES: type II toxin-antitoxin system antitoxin DNA ADP-ribosyl glycohydrolase DarG [Vibrio diabolicus subgroup]|uniref:type II toxin-antitoxin system antitoxin DNA ADP-ribosyl glycohydrolase DarG n=1 Tax=Vibrio diabolicus subgroup TaxID=2315253 RepID=UPI002659373F|nr:macro domain-containing protein [Vibrio antiquarius]MCR9476173.1 macro domain-containing protein [Vibrio antiquarius]
MISYEKGDLFNDDAEALVNAVNTVGVMGKGLAYQFKERFPENFEKYRAACKKEELSVGKVFYVELKDSERPRYILNFPTKAHWRGKSKIEYISEGVADLVRLVQELGISSVAVPALGSGLGGLPWSQVEKIILTAFEQAPEVQWNIYAPNDAPPERTKMKLTVGRTILLLALDSYLKSSRKDKLSELEAQGLVYLLNIKGVLSAIPYDTFRDSPFSSVLHDSLKKMDGHCLYLSGINKGPDATYISLDKSYVAEAKDLASKERIPLSSLRNLKELISGYQSNEGMSIISTALWVAEQSLNQDDDINRDQMIDIAFKYLSKQRGVSEGLIKGAFERLSEESWLP